MLGFAMGTSRRRQNRGSRRRDRTRQSPAVARCFDALNQVHRSAAAPNGEVAAALKFLRTRIIQLEKDHDRKAGAVAQIERWSARCSAALAFFLIHPLLAWWGAAGYPHPGPGFWADDNVIAAMSSAGGWTLAIVIVARAIVGAVLGYLLMAIVGLVLFSWLFAGQL